MLRVLKIKVSGFKLLEDNFTIDLTAKARVNQKDLEHEVIEVDKNLYVFRNYAFVGGNSSGKSTVLSLLLKVYAFLSSGRWKFISKDYKNETINLDIMFYLNGLIYEYLVILGKNKNNNYASESIFSPIISENLFYMKFDKTKGSKNLETFKTLKIKNDSFLSLSLNDTSAITKLTKDEVLMDAFYTNNISNFEEIMVKDTFFASLNSCEKDLSSSIIKLLDESIEYIIYNNSDYVRFKRFNENEEVIKTTELINILSSGTFRGVELYIRAIEAIKLGKIFIVDEIENCFHKNLVNNLLFLFNDYSINVKGAQLFFSTHYIEILDYLYRRDDIFITHKENGKINVKNLYLDYDVRTELLKSKQFDNNVFNTSLNYDQLMKVRRNVIHELQTDNDRRN